MCAVCMCCVKGRELSARIFSGFPFIDIGQTMTKTLKLNSAFIRKKGVLVKDNCKSSLWTMWKCFHHENSRTFCSALLSGTISSGFLSGIISALLSALSWIPGLFSLTACSPAWVMFLQKSTLTSSKLSPCVTTPSRLQSVMREQFSRRRQRSFLQLCNMASTSWSWMCPHPDRVSESRFGHLSDRQQTVTSLTKGRSSSRPPVLRVLVAQVLALLCLETYSICL